MIHDQLCDVLERSTRTLAWFSLGEPIRLAEYLIIICGEYRNNHGKYRKPLEEAAFRTSNLLKRLHGQNVHVLAKELDKLITKIHLETP